MAWAIEGGEALAAILAHSLAQDTAGAETKWIRAYTNRLARAQRRCRWIGKGLRSPSVSATVAGVLGVVPALAGPVIADLNAVEDR